MDLSLSLRSLFLAICLVSPAIAETVHPIFVTPAEVELQASPKKKPSEWTVDDAVARIEVALGGGRYSMGSGTCISTRNGVGVILTCAHVTGHNNTTITATFPDGAKFRCELVAATTTGEDLACLSFVATSDTPHTGVAEKAPERGAKVFKVGFPGGRMPANVREGRLLGWAGSRLKASTYVIPGDSGGGIFSDGGALVGVVSSYDSGDPSHHVNAVSTADINDFLEKTCWPRLKSRRERNHENPLPPIGGEPRAGGPVTPPPVMPTPDSVKPPEKADLSPLLKKLDELNGKIEELAKRPGVPGPAGPRGEQGPQGPPGKDADTAKLEAELASLRGDVAALKQTISQLSGVLRVEIKPQNK